MRMAMVIGVRPEKLAEYRALHASPWPEMNVALTEAHIHDYSIFLKQPENLLFGVWDYRGLDYEGDMKRLGEKDVTRRWLARSPIPARCRSPPPARANGGVSCLEPIRLKCIPSRLNDEGLLPDEDPPRRQDRP
jgi:L-rhamnose mutarotase